jgi:uncharacterized protein YukE
MPDDLFMVDLPELGSAIDRVSGERDAIQAGLTRAKATFANIEDHWRCPSGTTFESLAGQLSALSDELVALLDEAIERMRTTHINFSNTEAVNTGNLQ